MITGTIVMDLTRDSRESDRKQVGALNGIPDGARVVVNVGRRYIVEPDTIRHLADHANRLHLDFYGDTAAVSRWVAAAREDGAIW
ncbi:MAG TPA: hypothetical protein VHO29_04105 [Marmoricola sp.]|nr:hypothetical protein [Marmoricola sp.]